MKIFAIFLWIFSFPAIAHETLKAGDSLPGASVWQLNSTWTRQDGKSVKLTEFEGKSRLVIMLFTRCETACPLVVEDIRSIVGDLSPKQREKLGILLFSMDSERDTPEALAAFAKKRKLPDSWTLLTSTPGAVAELAAALGVRYKKLPNGGFIHSNVIYFLDEKGVIVARKEGLKTPRKEFLKEIRGVL